MTVSAEPEGRLASASSAALPASKRSKKQLSLALQGGGAFGAFTWGVLDRLLEEQDIAFDAVSGASAGAMNAVLLASGLAQGGPSQARASLNGSGARSATAPVWLGGTPSVHQIAC